MSLEKLFTDGTLISFHCSWWKGQVKLDKQDLGLKGEIPKSYIALGRKRLYPKSEFDKFMKLEQAARRYIRDNSLTFPIDYVYFVPNTVIIEVIREIEDCQNEFEMLRKSFERRYEEIQEYTTLSYRNIAVSIYDSNTIDRPREVFTEEFIRNIKSHYPEDISSKFDMNYSLFRISSPTLEINETNVNNIVNDNRVRAELTQAYKEKMDNEIEVFVKDAVVELRGRVIDALERLRQSFDSKSLVSEKSLKNVRRMINRFKSLNFMGDTQVEETLNSFKEKYLSANAKTYRANRSYLDSLKSSVDLVVSQVESSDIENITGGYIRKLQV